MDFILREAAAVVLVIGSEFGKHDSSIGITDLEDGLIHSWLDGRISAAVARTLRNICFLSNDTMKPVNQP